MNDEFRGFIRQLEHSPYWCERLERAGFFPADLDGCKDFSSFPVLTRGELDKNLHRIIAFSDETELEGLSRVYSSGSRGPVLQVPRTKADTAERWISFKKAALAFNVDLSSISSAAFLCALPNGTEYDTVLDPKAQVTVRRISVLRPGWKSRFEEIHAQLLLLSPDGLRACLYERPFARPRAVLSTACFLPHPLKMEAAVFFGCPVIDIYSTTETGPLAYSCPAIAGVFHVFPNIAFLEGEHEALVATRISRSVLPLLNYRLEDRGTVRSGRCSCGFEGQVLTCFTGRVSKRASVRQTEAQLGT